MSIVSAAKRISDVVAAIVGRAVWQCRAVLLTGRAVTVAAQTFSARMVAVPEGQTLRLRDDPGRHRSVRLRGIAAPVPGPPFGSWRAQPW